MAEPTNIEAPVTITLPTGALAPPGGITIIIRGFIQVIIISTIISKVVVIVRDILIRVIDARALEGMISITKQRAITKVMVRIITETLTGEEVDEFKREHLFPWSSQ